MKNPFQRAIAVALVACLTTGCSSSRTISFLSSPPGAVISAGGRTCTAPCELAVPLETATATATLPSGAQQEVAIGQLTAKNAATRYNVAKAGQYTSMSIVYPLLAVGGIAALLVWLTGATDDFPSEHPSRDRDIVVFTTITLGTAAGFVYIARNLEENADDVAPEVYISFPQSEAPPPKPAIEPLPYHNPNGTLKLFPEGLPAPQNRLK
ncbi:hypothetical protein [Geomesophilobacter sediminis]|uniref:Lipoprotein n=1 Tax=Geomesophilobacter sediminis TaxID=2798584 RepID=A0A8J7J2E6_9BACT|nr:hypothetical protein [Geomesophilobacter sediminis]MBJ6724918.1 hypothetical protein [Geomesophilobacter sediminis]